MLQPTLPAPVELTEIEAAYLDEEPVGLWPQNQDSNFGQHRKIFCDSLMDVANQLDLLLNEKFITTSTTYLWAHEEELGLTVNPAGKTIVQRQAALLSRRKRGPFTHGLVDSIVEAFVESTFGSALSFGTGGITLGTGVPLFSGASGDPKHFYRVYYDIRNFAYAVWIVNTVTPDLVALTRELQRITPSGIALTIDNTHAQILNYPNVIRNYQAQLYLPLGTVNDSSGYANNAVASGAPAMGGHASLVSSAVGADAATTFNGTSQYLTVADAATLHVGDQLSVGFWINLAALPSAGNRVTITRKAGSFSIQIDSTGKIYLTNDTIDLAVSTIGLVVGTTYYINIRKIGSLIKIFINDVDETDILNDVTTLVNTTNPITIMSAGTSQYVNGTLDEFNLYDYALDDAAVAAIYNTGMNIL